MPLYDIPLSADTVRSLTASGDARELIARDLQRDGTKFAGILSHYCRDDRGTATETSVSIDPEYMGLLGDLTGTVMVEFQEYAYYGCEHRNVLEDHEVEIPFRVNLAGRCIVLNVPETSRVSDHHRGYDGEDDD